MNHTLHRLFWRIHFWAGLISAPIVIFAALTGLLYALSPQIEARLYAGLDHVTAPANATAPRPLDQQVAAALAEHPHEALRYVVPAHGATDSTQVYLQAAHAHHQGKGEHDHGLPTGSIVYVNPYSAQVLGQLPELQRFKTWSKKLHSSALQGDGWRWLIELGASWMLVLFATGLVLWWPKSQAQGGPGWRALWPRRGSSKRLTWRDLHASIAIALGLVTLTVLVTGLTWAQHSGDNFRAAQQALGQGTPKAPKGLRSQPADGSTALSWQVVHEQVRAQAPDIAVQLTPPSGADGVWRAENFDRSQPTKRFTRVIDAYSGQTLFRSGWDQLPALSKATAVGIPFHRGEFGWWNQVLLILAALAAVFSVVSGLVMWWMRRPRGALAAPQVNRQTLRQLPTRTWWWLLPLVGALSLALPVFGWSLALFIGIEVVRLLLEKKTPMSSAA
ncbi:MAG: PepSY domain-containing protein [Aquabacterium sp.]|uniref:PepSY-associated TM helix domain-containing protein n=1 Tax=Aquabacterium sp. TaxID=1872578 RepID=UPI0027225D7B|nr:PepSY domain-containing protein [Aquabacterium sp.]MDO9005393.1 PepSY domain-containing protein [Aquabacterium sp.]